MSANQACFPIATMARVLGVSKAGYHAWLRRPPSAHAVTDEALLKRVRTVHATSRQTYGAPRVHADLRAQGERHGRKRIARLMRQAGLVGASHRHGGPTTTRRDKDARPAPDLVDRNFTASGPNQLWVADITYVPTAAGFLYLAVVLDAWSRKVVGWAMANHLRAELVLDALEMAVGQRRPKRRHSPQRPGQPRRIQLIVATPRGRELRCRHESAVRIGLVDCHCGRPAGRVWRAAGSTNGSGYRSQRACRARMPRLGRVCRRLLGQDGSGRQAACHQQRIDDRRSRFLAGISR